jgi:hypothetical protein
MTWLIHWEEISRRIQVGRYRLLLIDSWDSHLTISALKFYKISEVIIVLLPPHTSHFLQPLDVVVF